MAITGSEEPGLDAYLRGRLMPVEGVIPRLSGIEMYGNSVPAESVGGDLFEYINFQQRYNIDARIATARKLAETYLEPLPTGATPRNEVDMHAQWMASRPGFRPEDAVQYRRAKSSEQLRVAENLEEHFTTAGVLLVDAQGHGLIAAKIASTVHDTFHAFMLSELDHKGKVTIEFCEKVNLRLAQSVTARNALGRSTDSIAREIATMLYGEIRPHGSFRFVNFGHPPPVVFSFEYGRFMELNKRDMVQFPALGLEIPEDHPDRSLYISMTVRKHQMGWADIADITLMNRGDILFLHTDGVYDGADEDDRMRIEQVIRENKNRSAKEICNAVLDWAVRKDERLRLTAPEQIDDKTVFIIKRT